MINNIFWKPGDDVVCIENIDMQYLNIGQKYKICNIFTAQYTSSTHITIKTGLSIPYYVQPSIEFFMTEKDFKLIQRKEKLIIINSL